MNRTIKKSTILSILCLGLLLSISSNKVIAQRGAISITATADAKKIFLGTAVEVTFTIHNTNKGKFTPPVFKGFDIINGPMHSSSTQIYNGKVSSEESYSYTLEPKQIGKLRIESASLIYSGKTYKSRPIVIEIIKRKGSNASTQKDLQKEKGIEYFIRAEVDTSDVYLGQQVILNYKLYTRITIESYRILSEPKFPDFFVTDIRRFNQNTTKEIFDGEQYTTKILKKIALFPQKSGVLTIGESKFQLTIPIEDGKKTRRGFFSFRPSKNVYSTTKNIKLVVKPLPHTNEPSFSGSVGRFMMTSRIDKRQLTTDDALSIVMHIEGTGDIKTLKAPKMILGDSLEVYEPTVLSESNFDQNGLFLCSKEFEYLVLPKYPGNYSITPKFTYFDTDSLNYVTIANQSFRINVRQGTNSKKAIIPQSQREIVAEISDIIPKTTLYKKSKPFFGTIPFWILLGLPFIGLLGTFLYKKQQLKKDNIDITVKKSNMAERIAKERLKSVKVHLDNKDARSFYDEVSKSLFGYIGDKIQIKGSELDKNTIRNKMESLGIENTNIDDFIEILTTSELALFAGMGKESDMNHIYSKALDVVSKIENDVKKMI